MQPAAGQREVIRFQPGVPQVVMLSFDEGVQVDGRYGPQWQYFLEGSRIMWVDPEVHERIQATGARAGYELAITKHSAPGKKTRWEVARLEEEPAEAGSAATPAPPAPTGTAKPEPAAPRTINQPPQGSAAPQEAADKLTACLCAAVDAALAAQQYAAQRGLTLAWSAADIRAMAATLCIGSRTRE